MADERDRKNTHTPPLGVQLLRTKARAQSVSDANRTPVPPSRHGADQESRIQILESESVQVRREIEGERDLNAKTFVQVSDAMEKMFGRVSQEMERIDTSTLQRFENLGNKVEAKIDSVVRGVDLKIDTIAKEIAPKRISPLSLLIGVFSLLMAVGGIIWAASRYPERSEFLQEQKERREMQFELRDTMRDVRDLKEMQRRTP